MAVAQVRAEQVRVGICGKAGEVMRRVPASGARIVVFATFDQTHGCDLAGRPAEYPGWDSNPHVPKDTAF